VQLRLPHRRFHRNVGPYATAKFDPEGRLVSGAEFEANRDAWLISAGDRDHVASVMHGVFERGKMANWIAAPAKGINGLPVDCEYVKPPDA
jgi:benzoyl-CoA 2,3-dioxygenase component B